jgi:hypothetical protein
MDGVDGSLVRRISGWETESSISGRGFSGVVGHQLSKLCGREKAAGCSEGCHDVGVLSIVLVIGSIIIILRESLCWRWGPSRRIVHHGGIVE